MDLNRESIYKIYSNDTCYVKFLCGNLWLKYIEKFFRSRYVFFNFCLSFFFYNIILYLKLAFFWAATAAMYTNIQEASALLHILTALSRLPATDNTPWRHRQGCFLTVWISTVPRKGFWMSRKLLCDTRFHIHYLPSTNLHSDVLRCNTHLKCL